MESSVGSWLRCNKCYRLLKKSKRTFSLTQCQHVFCSTCIVDAEKKCPECKSISVKTVPLQNPLPPQLQHYFGRVGSCLQQCLDAARFQQYQLLIAFRRFSDIQGKYDDMKRCCLHITAQKKSLLTSYTQLKEKNEKIVAEIEHLRSIKSGRIAGTTRSSFMRASTDHRDQQNQSSMDYVMSSSHSRINVPRIDTISSSLNSSRSSIATPLIKQENRQPWQQYITQSAYKNRPKSEDQEYRYNSNTQSVLLPYPPRAMASYVVPTRNRVPESLESLHFSSTGGSRRHSSMVIDNHSNYCRN